VRAVSILFAFVCLFTAHVAFAAADEVSPCIDAMDPSISDHLLDLMNKGLVISQTDQRLEDRGLLVPGGGLCAPTCAVNALYAMASFMGIDLLSIADLSDAYVADIVARLQNEFGFDARYGARMENVLSILKPLLQELEPQAVLKTNVICNYLDEKYKGISVFPSDFKTAVNQLAFVSVITKSVDENNVEKQHALIILKIDEVNKRIHYFDPQFPRIHFVSRYKEVRFRGYQTIKLYDVSHFAKQNSKLFGTVTNLVKARLEKKH
jgi:hypothetical protein